MSRHCFTPEEIEFLRINAQENNYRDLMKLVNRHFNLKLNYSQIKGVSNRYIIQAKTQDRHYFTPEEIEFLRTNVAEESYRNLMDLFNEHFNLELSYHQIVGALRHHKLGIKKHECHQYSPEEIEFLKVNVPGRSQQEIVDLFNKRFGLKLSYERLRGFLSSRKLRNGLRIRPIGSERVGIEGYTHIKMPNAKRWKRKHVLIWEAANGPIPEGHVILFGDRDKRNFDPKNLLLVSKKELGLVNLKGLLHNDIELTKAGITIAKVYLKISERKKQISKSK